MIFKTPYSTWQPKWSETEHEVFRDFGYAAFSAQMLEAALIQILLAGERAGRISFSKKSDIESELLLSQKTLGELIKELKRDGIDDESAELLKDALEARNYLMHRFFAWHAEDFVTKRGVGECSMSYGNLGSGIGRVQKVFQQVRNHIFKEVYGVDEAQVRKLYEKYLKEQKE